MEKTPGTRCTDFVHIEIQRIRVDYGNIFRILASDLKKGIHFRVYLHRSPRMSRNFINNQIHIQEITHHVTSGTRCGCSDDLYFITCFVQQLSKKFLGHFNGFSFCGNIVFAHNLMGFIDQRVFGGGTADINAKKYSERRFAP